MKRIGTYIGIGMLACYMVVAGFWQFGTAQSTKVREAQILFSDSGHDHSGTVQGNANLHPITVDATGGISAATASISGNATMSAVFTQVIYGYGPATGTFIRIDEPAKAISFIADWNATAPFIQIDPEMGYFGLRNHSLDQTGVGFFVDALDGKVGVFDGVDPVIIIDSSGNVSASGSMTSATYYGDGSNLTGVGGEDPTKVAKAGDTMTGPLLINFDTATNSLIVTNASAGKAGYFNLTGANNSAALSGVNSIGVGTFSYGVYGQGNTGVYGNGNTGVYGIALSVGNGVYGVNSGGGIAVRADQSGTGEAVKGSNTNSTTGMAGYFSLSNTANTAAALTGITLGISATSYGVYGSAAGAGTSFYAATAGATGTLYGGNHTGTGGNLIQLQSGGVNKFVVDKNGVITSAGSAGITGCYDANNSGERITFVNGIITETSAVNCP